MRRTPPAAQPFVETDEIGRYGGVTLGELFLKRQQRALRIEHVLEAGEARLELVAGNLDGVLRGVDRRRDQNDEPPSARAGRGPPEAQDTANVRFGVGAACAHRFLHAAVDLHPIWQRGQTDRTPPYLCRIWISSICFNCVYEFG